MEVAQRGFGLTKDDLLDAVKKLVEADKRKTPFVNDRPGNRWYRSFMKRNPSVRLRSARPLEKNEPRFPLEIWTNGFLDMRNSSMTMASLTVPPRSGIAMKVGLTSRVELARSWVLLQQKKSHTGY
jgi:hypothetical protein